MTCDFCVKAQAAGMIAYYRIGTMQLGYGNIGLTGCTKHIKLALDRLNKASQEVRDRI